MGRPTAPDASVGVRDALAAKLRGHTRDLVDARCALDPDWQRPRGYRYVDPLSRMLKDLDAGKPVDVPPWMLHGITEVPAGSRLVRVDVDGSLSAAPYERGVTSTPGGVTPTRVRVLGDLVDSQNPACVRRLFFGRFRRR